MKGKNKKMRIVAIVPIKLNNERLPGKNTKILNGRPLIEYILESLNKVEKIDDVFVYCSSNEIRKYLIDGVKFLKRPAILDEPTSNFTQIFESFMSVIDADIYAYAHATAPLLTANTIQNCIDKVFSGEYDSSFTAEKIQDYLWHNGSPLNFDVTNIPRSQDITPVFRETSGLYVIKKEVFIKHKRRVGKKPYIAETSFIESVDINYPEDFELAEILLRDKEKNGE